MKLSKALKTRYSNSWGEYVTRDDATSWLTASSKFHDWVKSHIQSPDKVDEFIDYAHNDGELSNLYEDFVDDRKQYLKESDLDVPYNEFTEAAKVAASNLFNRTAQNGGGMGGNGSGGNGGNGGMGAPSVDIGELAAPSPGHVKNVDIPDPRKKRKKKKKKESLATRYVLYLVNEPKNTTKAVKSFDTEEEAWDYYNDTYKDRFKGIVKQAQLQRDISEQIPEQRFEIDLKGIFFTISDSLGALRELLQMATTRGNELPQLVQVLSTGGVDVNEIFETVSKLDTWLKNAYQAYTQLTQAKKLKKTSFRYKQAQMDWQHHVDSTISELEMLKQKFAELQKNFVQNVYVGLQDEDAQRVGFNFSKQIQAILHTLTQMQDRLPYMTQLEEAE